MILFLPESRPGLGSGHARRSFEAARAIRASGGQAFLGAPSGERLGFLRDILRHAYPDEDIDSFLLREHFGARDLSTVVFDSIQTEVESVLAWRERALVIGLDAGGPGRAHCDYLLDSLPRPKEPVPPNKVSTDFLRMPSRRRAATEGAERRFLVSFGGEDSKRLTEAAVRILRKRGVPADEISVTLPAREVSIPPGISILQAPSDLREELFRFEVVITAFGLTAFEARGAGAAVFLLHPSRYHRRLAGAAGFRSLRRQSLGGGSGRAVAGAGTRATSAPEPKEFDWPLPAELQRLSEAGPSRCPACGSAGGRVLARSEERTHYQCDTCTIVFAHRFRDAQVDYDASYFFEEYEAQYGRPYLEDLPAIVARGIDRIDFVEKSTDLSPPARALDLGCAYGAFLTALVDRGYSPFGVDIARDAVEYCREEGFDQVWAGDLRELPSKQPFGAVTFDLVSLWFVIEHFPDLGRVLSVLSDLSSWRAPDAGGLLAFSTPNLTGISGRRNLEAFLFQSPADHATVWSPRIAQKVLPRFGFEVVALRVTGHHPERFPGAGKVRPRGVVWNSLLYLSRLMGLGDTFEVVARRANKERA